MTAQGAQGGADERHDQQRDGPVAVYADLPDTDEDADNDLDEQTTATSVTAVRERAADSRPLRHSTGRPAGSTNGPVVEHPYADDPRLDAALQLLRQSPHPTGGAGLGVRLAHQLGISERAGQRLIAAARLAATAPNPRRPAHPG